MKLKAAGWAFIWGLVGMLSGCQSGKTNLPLPVPECRQLVVVTTPSWTSTSGTLVAYERTSRHWRQVGEAIAVTVGRNGMAWGPGLHAPELNKPPLKAEGDGKSPAGLFQLNSLFGYEDLRAEMPYLKVDENTFCVDDPKSRYYNQVVRGDEVEKDWSSAETMRMTTDHYKYGIVVGYNTAPDSISPGAGSCIFIHIGEPDGTTAGCTAMAEEDIKWLIGFLDKSRRPLILQGPIGACKEMAALYNLPLGQ